MSESSYWDLEGTFATKPDSAEAGSFGAKLLTLDGTRLATGKDFSLTGELTATKEVVLLDEAAATDLAAELNEAEFAVRSVEPKPYTKKPAAPFRTSTLQQEAGRKLVGETEPAIDTDFTVVPGGGSGRGRP